MKINLFAVEAILAERGMTKAELAHKSGFSRQNLSTIIHRGTCEPKTAGKLARGLNVPLEKIVVWEVEK